MLADGVSSETRGYNDNRLRHFSLVVTSDLIRVGDTSFVARNIGTPRDDRKPRSTVCVRSDGKFQPSRTHQSKKVFAKDKHKLSRY
jgi:hypothetical protein